MKKNIYLFELLTSNCALRVESIFPTLSSGVGDAILIRFILIFSRFPPLFSFPSSFLPLRLFLFFSAPLLPLFVVSLFLLGGVPTGWIGCVNCWGRITIEGTCSAVIAPSGDEIVSPSSPAC